MIFSQQQLFSDNQVIVATSISTNQIDLGIAGTPFDSQAPLHQDVGKSMIPVLVQVTEAFDILTSLVVSISKGATPALGTDIITETILLADLVVGKQFVLRYLPTEVDQRYLGISYVVVGGAPSVGKITAGITMGNQTNITGA